MPSTLIITGPIGNRASGTCALKPSPSSGSSYEKSIASPPVISDFQLSKSFRYSIALKPDRFSTILPPVEKPDLDPEDLASTSFNFLSSAGSSSCRLSTATTLPVPKPLRSPSIISPESPHDRIVSGRSVMNNTASKNALGISGLPLSFRNPFNNPKGSG